MDINKRSKLNFSIILLALFLAVALGLAVYGLYRLGLVQLPALRFEDAMPSGDSEEIEKLIESLANSEQIGEVDYRMLDSSVVIDVLATGRASNTYLHEYTVTYSDAEKGTTEFSVLRKNADFHLLEFKDGKIVREVLCVEGNADIFDARLNQRGTLAGVSGDFFEINSGSISAIDIINFVINFHRGTPVSWKLGMVNDCVIEAVREESVSMARITLTYSDHTDVYLLDIDGGLLYSYESYVEGVRVVSMKTTKFSYDIEGLELASVLN